jgi:SAM-dependent methyltransferase
MAGPDSHPAFEENASRYDALIDWDRRLANEEPFYRRLFAEIGVRSVLDVACGTGRHAAMFHSWGLTVEGADISPAMIAWCRSRLAQSPTLRWVQRSFDQPSQPPAAFDAVICVGNSLALAGSHETVRRVLTAMFTSLRPGGLAIIQVLNLWHLDEGVTIWQKCKRLTLDGQDRVLLKSIHRAGSRGFLDLAELTLTSAGVESRFDAAVFDGLEAHDLSAFLRQTGGTEPRLYGSFQLEPYVRHHSTDLILVSHRL